MKVLNVREFIKNNNEYANLLNPIISQKNSDNIFVFPGFCDVHVHFREPGFFYKESIKSGSQSASKGGYTCVFTMPNLNPVPDCYENLKLQLDIIERDSVIKTIPYASITKSQQGNELSDFENLAPHVIAFSDDGKGVQNREIMKSAMLKAKALNKIIVAHCEDNSLLDGGYIHKGEYALKNGHKGISSESEYMQIARDVELLKETGAKYHVCHVSTKESVEIIRNAKKQGVDITCETAPHYLVLNDSMLKDEGRFKMNPPIRSEEDRLALIEGVKDGTIDMIATDHAPHSQEEKSKGLKGSLMGIVGLETCFSVLYTHLVKTNVITLEKLIELLSTNARKRFGVTKNAGFTVWDLSENYVVDSSKFLTKGRSTPFENESVFAKCLLTVYDNKIVYKE